MGEVASYINRLQIRLCYAHRILLYWIYQVTDLRTVIDLIFEVWKSFVKQPIIVKFGLGLFTTVFGGLIVYGIKLLVREVINSTDFDIQFGFEEEYSGFYMSGKSGGPIGAQTIQECPRLTLMHQGRRDKARVSDIEVKVYRPYLPFSLVSFNPSYKIIQGQQPFAQGEIVKLQINASEALEHIRSATGSNTVKFKFNIKDAVSGQTFKTKKFEVNVSRLEERSTGYSK